MQTNNWYDFGALEVNPPNHRKTPHGTSGTRLRAPKRGDKKAWRNFLIFIISLSPEWNKTNLASSIKKLGITEKMLKSTSGKDFVIQDRSLISHRIQRDKLHYRLESPKIRALKSLHRMRMTKDLLDRGAPIDNISPWVKREYLIHLKDKTYLPMLLSLSGETSL